jgi:site-specific recombinase XerD
MALVETAKQSDITLAGFIGYLRRKKMSERTIDAYAYDVSGFLHHNGKATGSPQLSSIVAIQTKDVEKYLQGLARSGLNFASVRRASFALKNFFLFLLDQGVIHGNPAAALTVRPVKLGVLSSEQILSIFHYLVRRQLSGDDSDIVRYLRDELILLLMIFYGVPQYQLCTLRLSSIQTSKKSVSLVISTKCSIQLHLAMLRKLRVYLERRKLTSDFFFLETFSEKPIHRMTIRHTLNELSCALSIECSPKSLHDTYTFLQQHPETRESLIREILTSGSAHNYAGSMNA